MYYEAYCTICHSEAAIYTETGCNGAPTMSVHTSRQVLELVRYLYGSKYTFLSFEVRIRQKIRSYMNLAKCIEPMCWLGGMRYAIYMLLIGVEGVYA